MRDKIAAGTTSWSSPIFVTNSASGTGMPGLVFNTASLVGEYRRANSNSWTAITLAAGTLGTWSTNGWVADGNCNGAYEVGIPNAALAVNSAWAVVRYYGATNMAPVLLYFELDAVNYQSNTTFVNSVPLVTGTVNSVNGAVGSVAGNINGNITGNVNGNVGSIAGNVNGNVIGSVASVTGAVNSVAGNVGGNVNGSVNSVVGNVGGSTASILGVTFPTNFSVLAVDSGGNVRIQGSIKKNTALSGFQFYMALASDHVSPGTGLTITSTRSLDGGAFASTANLATEIGNGWYQLNLAASDLNGNTIALSFAATLCDTTILTAVTQP